MGGQSNLLIAKMPCFQKPSLILEGIQPSQAMLQLWVAIICLDENGDGGNSVLLQWVSNLLEEGAHAILYLTDI